jgi:Calcineurin-like phosphoesterase
MRNLLIACVLAAGVASAVGAQAPPVATPIDPGVIALPAEADSAGIRRFTFIAYGDTRGQADGSALQIEHGKVVDAMIAEVNARASSEFPVRFVVQSGDGVNAGSNAAQWNVSYTPLIERLIRDARVPYFLMAGNHDVTGRAVDDPDRQPGLTNTLSVMSKIYPPDGSARRLSGYPTFAFGYGNVFVLGLDSNISGDPIQLEWTARQLEGLDRMRYRHVIAVFHHPIFSSGPHGGPIVETQTEAFRRLYMPLFRRHHVRMILAGHDHLYDHWVERYSDASGEHRLDQIVSGGGGAPIYTYRGEPDLKEYLAAGAVNKVSVQHIVKPGPDDADNPHHFAVIRVDGEKLSVEVIGMAVTEYRPYGQKLVELVDVPVR